MGEDLRAAFLAAAPPVHAAALRDRADLAERLSEMVALGRAAWPTVPLDPAELVAFAATRLPADGDADAALASLDPGEVHLGCALVSGTPEGHAAFEAVYQPKIRAAAARYRLDPADVDEIAQTVRQRLFVAEPSRAPRIDDYAGRGELGAVVHVIAIRAAVSLLRARNRQRPLDGDALLRLRATDDLELDAIKAGQRAAFKDAFEAAVAALEPRDRNLLRLHLLEGVGLEPLARVHGVHRATVARWLAHARHQVFEETRRRLEEALGLPPAEAETLFRLIESRLDLSVERLLTTADPEPT